MHRPTVGWIAIGLLVLGGVARWQENESLGGAALRIGAVMAVLWFALPQMADLPRWMGVAAIAVVIVAARWPRLLAVVALVAIVLWVLRPRGPQNRVSDAFLL